MNHQDRRSKSILGRIRPWMWISFAGALAPLVLWAALSALNGGDLMSSPVGKTLTLNKTGVAVSKTTLENLLTSSKVSIALLVGTGQLLNPAVGTRVKVTYSELFRDTTIYQVLIQSGKYKGRTGWVMEQQTDWATYLPIRVSNRGRPDPPCISAQASSS